MSQPSGQGLDGLLRSDHMAAQGAVCSTQREHRHPEEVCREQEVVPSCWRECRDKKRHLEITWCKGFRHQSEELFFSLIIIPPRRVLNYCLRRVLWANWQNGFGERKKKSWIFSTGDPTGLSDLIIPRATLSQSRCLANNRKQALWFKWLFSKPYTTQFPACSTHHYTAHWLCGHSCSW